MRSDAVAVDALLERVGEVGGARWPAPIAEADRELRERLLQVLPRAWTDPVTQVRPAIEQVLRDRLPDVNDSDRDWRRTVSGYWDGSVGYAGVEPVDAFLDQVGGYLDDGLPSLTGAAERALRDDLVQVLVEPVPAEATRVLERFLTDAGVTDTIWLEVAVQSWWADVFTSDIVRARALLVQVDQYLDDGLPELAPTPDGEAYWTLADAVVRNRGGSSRQAVEEVSAALKSLWPTVADSDGDWATSVTSRWWAEFYDPSWDPSRFVDVVSCQSGDRWEVLGCHLELVLQDQLKNGGGADAVDSLPQELRVEIAATMKRWLEAPDNLSPLMPEFRDELSGFVSRSLEIRREVASAAVYRWFEEQFETILGVPESGAAAGPILPRLRVYSSRASVSDFLLREEALGFLVAGSAQTREKPSDAFESITERVGLLQRTIAGDDQLAGALVEELVERRGLRPCHHRVVLVGEWDTFYARSLARTFEDAYESSAASCRSARDRSPVAPDVVRVNYLRGMDGELPGDAPEAGRANDGQRAPAASTAEAAYRVSEQQERAAGRGQIDYVRRFAASIEELGAGDRPIGAVGVIGSDIYDKLLVLQALRPRFPRAQFFTTDLDARFIHPSVFACTRNLLVASHFGLELRRELQLGFLPFRDGYQTSTFLATRLAAGSGTEIDGLLESGQRPRLFEIARRRAVDITPEALGGASALNVHPPRMATVPGGGSLLMVGFIVLLATALVAPTSPALRRFLFTRGVVSEGDRWAVYAVSGLVLLLIVLMVSVGWTTDSTGGGEPFSILGGLSVWPTEMLRALATVLAVSFMFAGLAAIRRNDEQLGGACHLTLSTAKRSLVQPPPQAGRVGELVRWFTGATISEWGNMPEPLFGDGAREVKADRVWSRYLELGGTSHRFARCVPMAIVYLALSVAVVWFFDGSTMSWSRVSTRRFAVTPCGTWTSCSSC